MNGIVAIARFGGAPIDKMEYARMLGKLRHRRRSGPSWHVDDGVVVVGAIDQRGGASFHDVVVSADARLDEPDRLARELGLPNEAPPAELIAAAYSRFGDACVNRLDGEFAFVLWDRARQRIFAARDRFGVKPLYFLFEPRGQPHGGAGGEHLFACASEIAPLLAAPGFRVRLRAARIAIHLESIFEEGPGTFYESIERLPPAHRLVVENGALRIDSWWSLVAPPPLRLASPALYEEGFRERLRAAVVRRLSGAERPGSMLSGGLDSSSIVAFARRELAERGWPPLRTLTIAFPSGSVQDESPFVEKVVAQGQVEATFVDASGLDPVADALAESAASDEPIAGGNLCLSRAIYAQAGRLGVDVLFDGTDGDTVVSHGIGRLAELFARGRWWALCRESRAFASMVQSSTGAVVRRLAIAPVVRAAARRTPRLLSLSRRIRGGVLARESLLRPEVVRRFGLDEVRARHLAATSDLERYSSERELHLFALRGAIHPFVFEHLDRVAARHGVEPRYPMWDLPFVEYCLSLPAELKLAGGWTRRVMREAMAPLLPGEVAWRREKSNFSPNFVAAVRGHLLRPGSPPEEKWTDFLEEYVDPERLRNTADRLRSSPRVEDALSIWGILTLSQWLESRSAPPG